MSERKTIKNPLTIIYIFAGISEVSLTCSIPLINSQLQEIFIWFLVGFPVMIVVLFFITLFFRPEVLYAPSDFKNEENFLISLKLKNQRRSKKQG